jgi:sulfide dehydrogenase cytochrome subunit
MKNAKYLVLFAALVLIITVPVVGFSEASVSDGERLGKTCAGCHGTFGNTPGEYIGKIGGQGEAYLSKVLKSFAAGERPGSIEMSIMAKGYQPEQLESIAMYYGAQKWVSSTNEVDAAKAEMGKAISAENGCLDCHGANGVGMDEYPRIGGQNKGYLFEVLKRYRAGQIKADEMSMVADFSDEQLEALANYLTSLK